MSLNAMQASDRHDHSSLQRGNTRIHQRPQGSGTYKACYTVDGAKILNITIFMDLDEYYKVITFKSNHFAYYIIP